MNQPNIAVLISGRGSNLQAVIEATRSGRLQASVCAVISNRPDAGGLNIAKKQGIATQIVDHTTFPNRESFDQYLHAALVHANPEFVLLAGFMRILTAKFVSRWQGKMINIHPSLLPLYPGLDTHARALAAGDSEAGASVHYVTPQLDGGPVILQGRVPINNGDTPNTLAQRVLACEHQILPQALQWVCSGRVELKNDRCLIDGTHRKQPVTWRDGQLQFDHPVRSSEQSRENG